MVNESESTPMRRPTALRPFRGTMLRGLGVLCPPLLTILIVVWAINTTKSYFLEPVTAWAREGLVWCLEDVRDDLPAPVPPEKTVTKDLRRYEQLDNGTFIPQSVYEYVSKQADGAPPTTGEGYYRRYVELKFLRPYYTVPLLLVVFVSSLYFLGKFMAAGMGHFFAGLFDQMVLHVPGVRAIYSAVKQVSDFVFTEREFKFTRIVAVEYPRKGVWSMGFVTSEGLAAIHEVANEPLLTVLIPYSPLPITGCTITVRKSECIDLDITFDQACQFIVSCGVVVPPEQARKVVGGPEADTKT
jgi:uncharacterized membrane protein